MESFNLDRERFSLRRPSQVAASRQWTYKKKFSHHNVLFTHLNGIGQQKFRFQKREGFAMVLGMSLSTYTTLHVLISLIGIGSGFIVLYGLINGKLLSPWNVVFLVTTILTSLTGFGFPNDKVTPGIILGVLSMIVLAIALVALYLFHLRAGWRRTYAITAMIALYFNVFVLIAQTFEHVPTFHALAPTGTETPFKVAQTLLLVLFAVLITAAAKKFHTPLVPA
jgi:hypothetical protein